MSAVAASEEKEAVGSASEAVAATTETPAPVKNGAAVAEPDLSEGDVSECESLLWTCKECYVYKIPPLKNESGHRANDWNVNEWLWQGALKIVSRGNLLVAVLHDPKTFEVFAQCPQTEKGKSIDRVIDSSRYYVLRLDDGAKNHAYVGLGFREREDSYDFNATIIDHWKGVARQREADEMAKEMEVSEQPQLSALSH